VAWEAGEGCEHQQEAAPPHKHRAQSRGLATTSVGQSRDRGGFEACHSTSSESRICRNAGFASWLVRAVRWSAFDFEKFEMWFWYDPPTGPLWLLGSYRPRLPGNPDRLMWA
jgi:hypothetical protein